MADNCWPVTNGTFEPTMISASSLSSVNRLGVERILLSASDAMARTKNPKSISPVPNRPSARDKPDPSELGIPPADAAPAIPNAPSVAPPRLLKPIGTSFADPSSKKLMPNSRVLSSVISAITASTSTCARRISSWRITARIFCISSAGAVIIRELVFSSA